MNQILQNECVYHLFVSFYLLFTAFLAILTDVIFSCPKTTRHFILPKMSIMSVYTSLFILINNELFLYSCPFQYTLICLLTWPQSTFFSVCLKSCPIVTCDFHTISNAVVLLDTLEQSAYDLVFRTLLLVMSLISVCCIYSIIDTRCQQRNNVKESHV